MKIKFSSALLNLSP